MATRVLGMSDGSTSGVARLAACVALGLVLLPALGLPTLLAGCARDPAPPDVSAEVAEIRAKARTLSIVVVVLDAAAVGHFGFSGYDRDTTPHIDAIAAESVVFDAAYAQAAGTALSVYSYFTGTHPIFDDSVHIDQDTAVSLPPELDTMAEFLARRYDARLAMSANPWVKEDLGHAQGFTDFVQVWDIWDRRTDDSLSKDAEIPSRAFEWMRRHARSGFFAYLHFLSPHEPYQPPLGYAESFIEGELPREVGTHEYLHELGHGYPGDAAVEPMIALYDGSLRWVDERVGELVDRMKRGALWDSTIFVLTADHGEAFWQHDGFRGHGQRVYEEVVRVPLVVRIPGVAWLAGKRIATPVGLVDLLPTLLDLAGAPPGDTELHGRSMVPLVAGDPSGWEDGVFTRTNRKNPPLFALRRGDLKLICGRDGEGGELYDLSEDPGEQHDLWEGSRPPRRAHKMHAALMDWIEGKSHGRREIDSFPADSLDAKSLERLRALGYVR